MSSRPLLQSLAEEVRECSKCALSEGRIRAVPGEGSGSARVMVVGEAPGRNEDIEGRPFVGDAGRNLDRLLSKAGLKREDVFITNVVKCRPPENRRPRRDELVACHPYLRRQIEAIDPAFIVLLGDTALKEFFPGGSLTELHGKAVRRGDSTFFPTYHPAAMIYNRSLADTLDADFAALGAILQ